MDMFEDFEAALGIDPDDPRERLAKDLVESDHKLLDDLVKARIAAGMTKAQVAAAMGRHRAVVTNFERLTTDPHLSTIRRYAMAVGARITHRVEPGFLPSKTPQSSQAAYVLDVDVDDEGLRVDPIGAESSIVAAFSAGAVAGVAVSLEKVAR
jgi:transcriptional regulator with XRE-family HTH domain